MLSIEEIKLLIEKLEKVNEAAIIISSMMRMNRKAMDKYN